MLYLSITNVSETPGSGVHDNKSGLHHNLQLSSSDAQAKIYDKQFAKVTSQASVEFIARLRLFTIQLIQEFEVQVS